MKSQELFFVFRLKKIIEYMRMCNVEIQKGQEKVQIKKRLCPSSSYYTTVCTYMVGADCIQAPQTAAV